MARSAVVVAVALGTAVATAAALPGSTAPDALAAANRLLTASRFTQRRIPPPDVEAIVDAVAVNCIDRNAQMPKHYTDCEAEEQRMRAVAQGAAASYPRRRAALLDAAARIYAAHLTAEEMTKAAAFYDSEAGRRLLDAEPKIEDEFRAEEVRLTLNSLGHYPSLERLGSGARP